MEDARANLVKIDFFFYWKYVRSQTAGEISASTNFWNGLLETFSKQVITKINIGTCTAPPDVMAYIIIVIICLFVTYCIRTGDT